MTESELLAEITKELCLPELDEADITVNKIVKETGLSHSAIRRYARNKVECGEWGTINKRDKRGNPVAVFVMNEVTHE